MSSCPAGLQRLSFDVIEPAFSRRLPPVAAHLDIGAAVRKLSRFAVLSVSEKAGRTRSRLPEEKDKRKSGCAGQISPGEFFANALRTFGWLVAFAHRPQAPAKRLKTAG